jgi:GNAT superfamily N-acetyltransferase
MSQASSSKPAWQYRAPEPLDARHVVDGFSCGEIALDDWLKKHARASHAGGAARVFVTTTDDEPDVVVGYYALASVSVEAEDATERALKGQPRARPVPAILLARLAVDGDHQIQGVGKALLKDVMLRCLQVAEQVGVRVLLVHAKHDEAKDWYMRYDFEESPTDPLHLMMMMKDVAAGLRG